MTDVENNEEVAETSEETESSPVEEEQKVPFSRLKEVIDERDQLRQTNAKLLELDKKEEYQEAARRMYNALPEGSEYRKYLEPYLAKNTQKQEEK